MKCQVCSWSNVAKTDQLKTELKRTSQPDGPRWGPADMFNQVGEIHIPGRLAAGSIVSSYCQGYRWPCGSALPHLSSQESASQIRFSIHASKTFFEYISGYRNTSD